MKPHSTFGAVLLLLTSASAAEIAAITNLSAQHITAFLAESGFTNVLTFPADNRGGAKIFIDECLSRGLTNAMTLPELRSWTTNIIAEYRHAKGKRIATKNIPPKLQMLHTSIPTCRFSLAESTNEFYFYGPEPTPPSVTLTRGFFGGVKSIGVSWYIYGIILGPESFKPTWQREPWYHRKLADGVYLWHGYK